MYYNNQWYPLTVEQCSTITVNVICTQLLYETVIDTYPTTLNQCTTNSNTTAAAIVNCTGAEVSLLQCSIYIDRDYRSAVYCGVTCASKYLLYLSLCAKNLYCSLKFIGYVYIHTYICYLCT